MNWKKTLAIAAGTALALAVIAALGVFSWSAIAAQTPPAAGPTGTKVVTAAGKITAVSKDGVTLETHQGLVNVTINAQTWIVLDGRDKNAGPTGLLEATSADLKVDLIVNVAGTSPAAGQIVARLVKEGPGDFGFGPPPAFAGQPDAPRPGPVPPNGPPPGAGPGGLPGTIAMIQGNDFALILDGNRIAPVHTSTGTIVLKNGFATVGDLKVGDMIVVNPALAGPGGQKPAPGSPPTPAGIPAGLIWVPQADEHLVQGMVLAVSGNTITVHSPDGELTAQVDSATAYKRNAGPDQAPAAAALSDVQAHTPIIVMGTGLNRDTRTLTAKALILQPAPPAAPANNGNGSQNTPP